MANMLDTLAEVVDLRQYRAAQLDELLKAETAEWQAELDWDYGSSADLIRQYVDSRVLPGYVLAPPPHSTKPPAGYGFFVYEARKGMIGDLFVHPVYRNPDRHSERRLLGHMIETLQATPGLERIEAQLMTFRPDDLADAFTARAFRAYRRLFLHLELAPWRDHVAGGDAIASGSSIEPAIEPWSAGDYEPAAQLILQSYRDHVDSRINDQYCSFAGALRFLQNIAHYPGCGVFDERASLLARDPSPHGGIAGMILISRVRPDVAHITQVCVSPTRQGHGLGRRLLSRALTHLRDIGMRAVTLTVTRDNATACRLYESLGFATLREFDAYVWERPA